MARRDPILERIATLEEILKDPDTKASRKRLKEALLKKTTLVVARAAELALELQRHELVPDLTATFFRLLEAGWEADRGCRAKEAIAKTLDGLEARSFDVFLAGVRCVQLEPAMGKPVDTAVGLRGVSAVALVNGGYHDAANVLARLLADPERSARANAAAALGGLSPMAAVPLLRYKAVLGDAEPEVTSEVFSALLQLDGEESVDFVAGFLGSAEDVVAEVAAITLGQSRLDAALEVLKRWAGSSSRGPTMRKTAYVAIAMHRTPSSHDFLCEVVRTANAAEASLAVDALGIYRHDRALMKRVEAAVRQRDDPSLIQRLESICAPP